MEKTKSPHDSPEYVSALSKFESKRDELTRNREREITIQAEITNPLIPIPTRRRLGEELNLLQIREPELIEELDDATQQLAAVRGKLGPALCQPARDADIHDIKELLGHLKAILGINARVAARHSKLEESGVSLSSLPLPTFDVGGLWDDPYGSRIKGYRGWIASNYPELKKEVE